MSLLSPEHLRIALGPGYAMLAELAGGKIAHCRVHLPPPGEPASWQANLAVVADWLRERASRRASAAVALGAELAPLQLMPWRDDASREREQALLAAARFRAIYGKPAEDWVIRVAPSGFGRPWIAAGIDAQLPQAIDDMLRSLNLRVASLQSLPISLGNALAGRIREQNAWLLTAEPRVATAMLWRDGRLSLVKTMPLASFGGAPLAEILLRECRIAGLPDLAADIHVAGMQFLPTGVGMDAVAADPGWKFHADIPTTLPVHLLGGRA